LKREENIILPVGAAEADNIITGRRLSMDSGSAKREKISIPLILGLLLEQLVGEFQALLIYLPDSLLSWQL